MKSSWITPIILVVAGVIIGVVGTLTVKSWFKKPTIPTVTVPVDPANGGTITTGDIPSEVNELKISVERLNKEKKALTEKLAILDKLYTSAATGQDELEHKLDNLLAKGTLDSADIAGLRADMIKNRNKMAEVTKALKDAKDQLAKLEATGPDYTYKKFDTTFRMGLSGSVGYGFDSYYINTPPLVRKGYVDASLYAKFLYLDAGKAGVYTMGIGQSMFRPKSYIFIRRGIKDLVPFMRNTGVGLQYTYDWNKSHEIQAAIGVDF